MDDNNIVVVPAVARLRHRRRVINYAGEFRDRVSRCRQKIRLRQKIVLFYSRGGKKSIKTHQRLELDKKNTRNNIIII